MEESSLVDVGEMQQAGMGIFNVHFSRAITKFLCIFNSETKLFILIGCYFMDPLLFRVSAVCLRCWAEAFKHLCEVTVGLTLIPRSLSGAISTPLLFSLVGTAVDISGGLRAIIWHYSAAIDHEDTVVRLGQSSCTYMFITTLQIASHNCAYQKFRMRKSNISFDDKDAL
jgi:hypothetical protein